VPASFGIRTALAACLLPRWGGSYEEVAAVADEAAERVPEHPALAALRGLVDWDRGRVAAKEQGDEAAAALYTRALEAGEYWRYYESRASAYYRLKRYTDTLADLSRGLALLPEQPGMLVLRAKTLLALERPGEAVADIRLVAAIDPTSDDLASFRKRELETGVQRGHQLLTVTNDPAGAARRLTATIELTGGNGDAYYWRGRAYLFTKDMDRALADFEEAIRRDERHLEAYRNVDYILAKRGDFDGIVARWTGYIALEPMSGQAYLERAGAHKAKGDMTAAFADLRKSCSLGHREACDIERRAGG
jgi:tetratricopeptide (TPR) repeat protein